MANVKHITGGVCAPQGFRAGGLHCGIAKSFDKKDLALIVSDIPCAAAAVYTTNVVKAAPLGVTKKHLENGMAQAILCNSGNANACTADGVDVANKMCESAAEALSLNPEDIIVASTGVIGVSLNPHPIDAGMSRLVEDISYDGSDDCSAAIMTTDTLKKEIAVEFEIGGKTCRIGAICKGSGMIHPNMGTMLGFITTDVDITCEMLDYALGMIVPDTFNMVSVDGDTSTNDMVAILANGVAANPQIKEETEDFRRFCQALMVICIYLARMIAKDGEGATKLLECSVEGAPNDAIARTLAKSVITSSLFKAAMYGADANWGRVLCAMGYSGAAFDPTTVSVSFVSDAGRVDVCKNGAGITFSEVTAKRVLSEDEVEIKISLGEGEGRAVAWGCDLTYDYVKINGDYRS